MTKDSRNWKILAESIYAEFHIFTLKKSHRLNPRTQVAHDFFLMQGLDWVNVIPLTSDNKVVLVRQYRHGAEAHTLEIPGGCIEPGEDPVHSAERELREETGYAPERIEHLGTMFPNPAMQSMKLHIYTAHNVQKVAPPELDAGEDITVELAPLPEVLQMVKSGKINHALVVAAFALYMLR